MTENDEESGDDLDGRAMNMNDVFESSEPDPVSASSDNPTEAEASETSGSKSDFTATTESETSKPSIPTGASPSSQTSRSDTETTEDSSLTIPLAESEGADSIVAEPTQSKVARERHGIQFYLTEELYTREERIYDQLNQLYKHKFGTELEKNRQYRQEIVALALEHPDELRERLDIADVDLSEVFDLL